MAMTQSPGAICDESPNLTSGIGAVGLLDELDERAVGQLIAADQLRRIEPLVVAVERHLNLRRALDDVVVGQDEAVLADDEAGAGCARHLRPAAIAARPGSCSGRVRSARCVGPAEKPAEQVVVATAATEEIGKILPWPSSRS